MRWSKLVQWRNRYYKNGFSKLQVFWVFPRFRITLVFSFPVMQWALQALMKTPFADIFDE